jgi:hypothetical protein
MWGNPPLLATAVAKPHTRSMEKPHRYGQTTVLPVLRLRGVPHVRVGPLNVTLRGLSTPRVAVWCRQRPPTTGAVLRHPTRCARCVCANREAANQSDVFECHHVSYPALCERFGVQTSSPPFVDTTYSLPGRGSHVYGPGNVRGHTGSGRRIDAPVGGAAPCVSHPPL